MNPKGKFWLINLGITDVFSDDYKNLNLDDKTLNLIEYKKQKNPLKNLIKHVSDEIHFDFYEAISNKPNIQIIAELKRSSASAGNLQTNLSIEEITKIILNKKK